MSDKAAPNRIKTKMIADACALTKRAVKSETFLTASNGLDGREATKRAMIHRTLSRLATDKEFESLMVQYVGCRAPTPAIKTALTRMRIVRASIVEQRSATHRVPALTRRTYGDVLRAGQLEKLNNKSSLNQDDARRT